MRSRSSCRWWIGLVALVGSLASSQADAVTLRIESGILVGASGVEIGGTLFDVEFVDGSCIDLYDGCDSALDFTFQTRDSAAQAGQALIDQVFLDGAEGAFDTQPELTFGCRRSCGVFIPWQPGPDLRMALAKNVPGAVFDSVSQMGFPAEFDTTLEIGDYVWARFARPGAPIPEPGAAAMWGLGSLLASRRLGRRSRAGSRRS